MIVFHDRVNRSHVQGTQTAPITAMRAFEVAARHLSFMAAVAEIHVTPSAISHQVKTLVEPLNRLMR